MSQVLEKWYNFKKLNKDKYVIKVEEKKVISNEATVGIYNFKYGSDFFNLKTNSNKDLIKQ